MTIVINVVGMSVLGGLSFINNAKAVSIVEKPGVIYNLSACEKYVLTQPVGSIKTLINIHGADAFIEMINSAPAPKNPKYRRLIAEVEHQRSVRESLERDPFIELQSDTQLDEYAEFIDELRQGYRMVDLLAKDKQKKRDRITSEEWLRKHGLDLK